MKILFLSHFYSPHIGGVEKHVQLLSKELIKKGHKITLITEKYDTNLKGVELIEHIKVIRFKYPKIKFFGIFYIWFYLLKNISLLQKSDIIHIHDVFIWYLPFRFLLPHKKIVTTIHGLEWGNPLSFSGLVQKRLTVLLSNKTIGIGQFLEKYLHVKFDLLSYGAVDTPKTNFKKTKNSLVFIGRLSKDTGILELLKWLQNKKYKVDFIGDGDLKNKCEKFGTVHGFTDPIPFLKKAEYCIPGGYLTCLEAFAYQCKVKVFFHSQLKKDYWQLSPMYKLIQNNDSLKAYNWVRKQSWEKLADESLSLYNSIK